MYRIAGVWLGVCLISFVLMTPSSSAMAGGPETLNLGQVQLKLNGTGYRKKSLLTLYEGSLYLQQPNRDATAVVSAEAPMAIRIQITSGFVSQQKMLAALDEGFQKSTSGNTAGIADQLAEFRRCFADPINKNDVFVLSYLPGSGVLVHKNGKQKGRIAGNEFKQALFGIWLSDRPVDESLKQAMLGR